MKANTKPLVTVCIPCYNHSEFVGECIQSVINQTYQNIELIIIDDGSSDNSVAVIEAYIVACERRFVRFKFYSRPNRGLSATLNEALVWGEGDYFSPIASDDIALPHKVSTLANHLESHPQHLAVLGGAYEVDVHGRVMRTLAIESVECREWSFNAIILGRAVLIAPTFMVRKGALISVGGFNEKTILEDWDLWLKLTSKQPLSIATVGDIVSMYRIHESNTHKKHWVMYMARFDVICTYMPRPVSVMALLKFSAILVKGLAQSFHCARKRRYPFD